MAKDTFFEGLEQLPSKWWGVGKVGDRFKGVYVYKYEQDDSYNPGKKKIVYVCKAEQGHFHNKDGEKQEIVAGEYYNVPNRYGMYKAMLLAKMGQVVAYEYTEDVPTDKGNDAKAVKTMVGAVDPDFVAPSFAPAEDVAPEVVDTSKMGRFVDSDGKPADAADVPFV